MKTFLFALMISLFSVPTFANTLVTCTELVDPNNFLLLTISNQKLIYAQAQIQGSLPRNLSLRLLSTDQHTSLYRISGSEQGSELEVDNSILRLGGGLAKIGRDIYDCE